MLGTQSDFCIRSRKWSSASQWGRAYFTSITSTLSCYQGLNLTYAVTNRVQWLWWQSARHCAKQYPAEYTEDTAWSYVAIYLKWIIYELKWRRVKDDDETLFQRIILAYNKRCSNFKLMFANFSADVLIFSREGWPGPGFVDKNPTNNTSD